MTKKRAPSIVSPPASNRHGDSKENARGGERASMRGGEVGRPCRNRRFETYTEGQKVSTKGGEEKEFSTKPAKTGQPVEIRGERLRHKPEKERDPRALDTSGSRLVKEKEGGGEPVRPSLYTGKREKRGRGTGKSGEPTKPKQGNNGQRKTTDFRGWGSEVAHDFWKTEKGSGHGHGKKAEPKVRKRESTQRDAADRLKGWPRTRIY